MRLRQRALPIGAALIAAYVVVIFATPTGTFAHHSPMLRLVIECLVAALFGVAAVAGIVWAEQRRDTTSVLLCGGLISATIDEWWFGVLPAALHDPLLTSEIIWGRIVAALVVLATFALVAYVPTRKVGTSLGAKLALSAPVLAAFGATVGVTAARAHVRFAGPGDYPRVRADGDLLAFQILAAVLCLVAAVGLIRKSRQLGLPLLARLADVVVLLAAARLAYFRMPSLYVSWVSIGDLFRFAGVVMLAVVLVLGVAREARAAALARERARIAGEIHSGLAQELSLLVMRLGSRAATSDDVAVARRALDSSRAVIRELRAS